MSCVFDCFTQLKMVTLTYSHIGKENLAQVTTVQDPTSQRLKKILLTKKIQRSQCNIWALCYTGNEGGVSGGSWMFIKCRAAALVIRKHLSRSRSELLVCDGAERPLIYSELGCPWQGWHLLKEE